MAKYLDEVALRSEIIACKKTGVASTKLAEYFMLIANKLAGGFKYVNPMDREDAVGNAVTVLLEKYHQFDETLGTNCFSYMTQTALNGLRGGWNQCAGHLKFTSSIDSVFEESI